jgi:hypothetical protein
MVFSRTFIFGENMGEVIQFIPKSERERTRQIRRARALYESIFPPSDLVSEKRDNTPGSAVTSNANACRSDGGPLS